MHRLTAVWGFVLLALMTPLAAGCGVTAPGAGVTQARVAGLLVTDQNSVSVSTRALATREDGAHGAVVTQASSLSLDSVTVSTRGTLAIPLAAIQSDAVIAAVDSAVISSGSGSPCLYSAGSITVTGGIYEALRSEVAIVEGASSVTATDAALSSKGGGRGVMLYSPTQAIHAQGPAVFAMRGGSLVYADKSGPLFYVTNTTADIHLTAANVACLSGTLLTAAVDEWGAAGSNGGHASLTANNQTLTGNLTADPLSTLDLILANNSCLTGAINPEGTAAAAGLTLDCSSCWRVTADSYLTHVTILDGTLSDGLSCIIGAGHTVYYDATSSGNAVLGGETYALRGGGYLTPYYAETTCR